MNGISKINKLKLDVSLIEFDAKNMSPQEILQPRMAINLTGVADGVFIKKLIKFLKKEINPRIEPEPEIVID